MPLPSPNKKQGEDSFVSNCMSNETMKREFPNKKQRLAVCYSKHKNSKKNSKSSEVEWSDSEVDDNLYIIY